MKRLFLMAAVAIFTAAQAMADWSDAKYADITNAIQAENYSEAYALALANHLDGDTIGTYAVSAMMICGDGCERDYPTAINYLMPLAQDGDERAQYMLAGFETLLQSKKVLAELDPDHVQDVDDNFLWYQMMSNFNQTGQKSYNFKDVFNWLASPLREVWYGDIMYWAGIMCVRGDFGADQDQNGVKWLQRSANSGFEPAQKLIKSFSVKDVN